MISRCKVTHYTSSKNFSFSFKKCHKQYQRLYENKSFPRRTCISFSSFASAGAPEWNSKILQCPNESSFDKNRPQNKKKEKEVIVEEEEVIFGDRKVLCEVEVISWRERRIKAEISINADVQSVWHALTDYERLADFIPNLISRSSNTILSYEVNVIPRFNFPAIFLERIIRSDLPINLQAIACRSESDFEGNQNIVLSHNSLNTPSLHSLSLGSVEIDGAAIVKKDTKEKFVKASFGPLSPSTGELNGSWRMFGKSCSLDRPCIVDEVHLRRFDGLLENGGVHRCVVACITVKAPVRDVWNVLTAYESLPEIVPNLAISKVLSRENNEVRILQEGCKGLLYMVLHARVVLDLCENLEQEISFEQVEGDFNAFRGKWILEKLGSHHTLLKYLVESKMHQNSFLSEVIVEEVIYEDLPSNLCAIRDYVEKGESGHNEENLNYSSYSEGATASSSNNISYNASMSAEHSDCSSPSSSRQRPKVLGLQRDIEVLKSELFNFISEHGQEGFMPLRKQLREQGRVDIEKAITRMGGFRRIASLMNLSLAYKHRKPKGYWDNLENLEEEINRFQRNWGMDLSFMPSRKSFERAGRYDIARALEKWGGLHEVSRLLSLKMRHPSRQAALAKEKKIDFRASNNLNGPEKIQSRTCVSQDTQNWQMKLKGFDINWDE